MFQEDNLLFPPLFPFYEQLREDEKEKEAGVERIEQHKPRLKEKRMKKHTGMKHRFQEVVKLSNQTGVKKFSTARMNLEITKQLVAQSNLRARTAMWTI